MIVNVWSTKGDNNFWYEKNNEAAWDLQGSPDVFSPGITLEDPMPLAQRGGLYYGFEPIVIPAGTTKGIYLALDPSSIDDNYIGMDRKSSSICADDFREPFDFDTWFEDDMLAVSEGVYKNQGWSASFGTSNDSFRFLGSIYYHTGTSLSPSISSPPSLSSQPSISPSISSVPSEEPTGSRRFLRGLVPSPAENPGRRLDETLINLSSPSITGPTSTVTVVALDTIMFEVEAKSQNIILRNFELVIISVSPEYVNEEVELSVYTTPDSFYDSSLSVGDGVAQEGWAEQGTVQVTAGTTLEYRALPGVSDIYIEKGSTIGIFIAIKDPLRNHKILLREGGTLLGEDFSNEDILVRTGLSKQWEHCLDWGGETFRDYTNK